MGTSSSRERAKLGRLDQQRLYNAHKISLIYCVGNISVLVQHKGIANNNKHCEMYSLFLVGVRQNECMYL